MNSKLLGQNHGQYRCSTLDIYTWCHQSASNLHVLRSEGHKACFLQVTNLHPAWDVSENRTNVNDNSRSLDGIKWFTVSKTRTWRNSDQKNDAVETWKQQVLDCCNMIIAFAELQPSLLRKIESSHFFVGQKRSGCLPVTLGTFYLFIYIFFRRV